MTVHIDLTFQDVLQLTQQLEPQEQQALIDYLQKRTRLERLTDQEWEAQFDAVKITLPIAEGFSLDREDWYSDDRQ